MTIIGIDPGNKQSGWCCVQDGKIVGSGVMENKQLINLTAFNGRDVTLAIEWIQAMGMAVGKEVFETCFWAGRFAQMHRGPVRLIPRGRIKLHHCGSARAKDGNVAQSLRDKYGDKGTKAAPGYFYGVSSHAWQAFAVAAYVMEGADHESEIKIP
jgi:hypothetical protein